MSLKRSLSLVDIVLMNLVAVISLRWIASAASIGPASLVLWLCATLFFFVPEGLAVADLSHRDPGEGGLYRWTKRSLGDGHAFLCGWCYWVNNLLYFPALLLFVSANAAFALSHLHPEWQLEHNKQFVVAITLGTLWLVAALSVVGMQAGKWLQNMGALGNWVPGIVIAGLGALFYFAHGSANPFTLATLTPKLDLSQLSFFSQMCFALAGLELVSFLGGEIKDSQRSISRAVLVSAFLIAGVYWIGTLGILVSVPQAKITAMNGILLPIQEVGTQLHVGWLSGVCAILITLGGIGTTMAWFAGAARVPYLVGVDDYLPKSFGRLHPRFQTPYVAVMWQVIIATIFTLFATAGAETKMETAYKIMCDLCLILYFIPYCYLFLSQWKLNRRKRALLTSAVGLATTLLAIATSFLPSSEIFDWPSFLKTLGGAIVMVGAGLAIYWWRSSPSAVTLPEPGR